MIQNFLNGLFHDGFTTIILLLAAVGLCFYWTWDVHRGTPKGPWGIPLFGYAPFLSKDPYKDFVKMAKRYQDVFSIRLGSNSLIVVNGFDAMKESLVKNGDVYTGMPKDEGIVAEFGDYCSIFVTDGDIWKEQRRFMLSTMRDFGFGKSRMEEHIQEEAKIAIDELTKLYENSWDFSKLFSSMTSNIISFLCFGKRFNYDDRDITDTIKQLSEIDSEPFFFDIVTLFPALLKVIPKTLFKGYRQVLKLKKSCSSFLDKAKLEHIKRFDGDNVLDVMDMYLKKSHQLVTKGYKVEDTVYTDKHMKANLMLLFAAGTDTTSSSLSWALKLLAAHPEIQKQLQQEIEDVIGRTRLPAMADRLQMPLMEAFLLEVQRYISLLPLSSPHTTTRDTMLKQHRIPKDSKVMFNFWSVHYDACVWDKPEEFNFRRFLDDNNKISNLRDYVIPFSLGKRSCLGESLAKMELFIFLTSFVQHFTFYPPDGEKLTFECSSSPLRKLKSCNLRAVPRQ